MVEESGIDWKKGDKVLYCKDIDSDSSVTRRGRIIGVDQDEDLNPYYVVRFDDDGSERHTVSKFLMHLEDEDFHDNEQMSKPPPQETQVAENIEEPEKQPTDSVVDKATIIDGVDMEDESSTEPEQPTNQTQHSSEENRPHSPQANQANTQQEIPTESSQTEVDNPTVSLSQQNNDSESDHSWNEGDDVLYSNDDDFQLTREATVIRIDKDSVFGTFYVIKFKDDDTQRIALPKRLHLIGTSPKSSEKDWVDRENFLKNHFPNKEDQKQSLSIESDGNVTQTEARAAPPPEAFQRNAENQKTSNNSDGSLMTREMMKSAMKAHQKNKMDLRKQTQQIEMKKKMTNRERIQAAMQNLGRPVKNPEPLEKSISASSMASERSSDMVQRFAVFQQDNDDSSSDGEQSEITAPIRNSHKGNSSLEIDSKPQRGHQRAQSSFGLFRKASFLKSKVATIHESSGDKAYWKVPASESNLGDIESDPQTTVPAATEIIGSLDGPKRSNRRKTLPTIVTDFPNRRARLPSFKSQTNKYPSDIYPISPDEGVPIAVASNISEMSFHTGDPQENRSFLLKSSIAQERSQRRLLFVCLAVIFLVATTSVAILTVLQVRQNSLSKEIVNSEHQPKDTGELSSPKILSESYIQSFGGIDLAPLDSNQVSIWEAIIEDYASYFLEENKGVVTTKCVINFQVHEASVAWNRNKKRKKKNPEEDSPVTRKRQLSPTGIDQYKTSSNSDYNSIKIDFTLTFSTVSNGVDLDDYPMKFLEQINSVKINEDMLMKLQGRLQIAVEDVGDVHLRNENGAEVFLITSPTLNPTLNPTKSPTASPSLTHSRSPSKFPSFAPSLSPSSSPTSSPTPQPSGTPTTPAPTRTPTHQPTKRPTPDPYCCQWGVFGHCIIPC